jgi:pimeloyl-ACP methyl ester carboxylesterase
MPRRAALVALALLAATASGCIMGDLWQTRRFERTRAEYAYVEGTVGGGKPGDHWLVVFVVTVPCDGDWRALMAARNRGELAAPARGPSPAVTQLMARVTDEVEIAAHFVLQQPGRWYARLAPGCYGVGAYQDANDNRHYDDDPAANLLGAPDRLFELRAGERREHLAITIPPDGRLRAGAAEILEQRVQRLETRSPGTQLLVSLDEVAVAGEIADLRDARFGPEGGRLGYFDPYTFAWKIRPGVYFREPYDPKKIPVLFVHGAVGHPSVFATLADGLDSARFQPWFFYYPSGARLDGVSDFLSETMAQLQRDLGFGRVAVVAHSMGGLVARSFIFKHHERMRTDPVRLFVSISSPWGGMASAKEGAEHSPVVVPSWNDVAEGSEFLHGLFFTDPGARARRHLPAQVPYYLIFGVDDRTISLASGIRWEALRDAKDRWPLPYDHTGILRSSELAQLLREILARELG